jgi:hypothetical protein
MGGWPGTFRAMMREAAHFWEPRRLIYNLVLALVFAGWVILSWPHFRTAFTLQSLLFLVVLALMANLCYTGAYVVDLALQRSPLRGIWQRGRWWLWLAGMLVAVLFVNYWIADEIYPYVR